MFGDNKRRKSAFVQSYGNSLTRRRKQSEIMNNKALFIQFCISKIIPTLQKLE